MTAEPTLEKEDPDRPLEPVLVVDLDGTLCRTDTLHEALLRAVVQTPAILRRLPGWLRQGRAGFKAALAGHQVMPAEALPINEEVMALIEAARADGRPVALVSAADQRQVDLIADALGPFDAAVGSTPERNLKGAEKARYLVAEYGEKGFDYIGDAEADLPIWAVARRAVTVRASKRLRHAAEAVSDDISHIDPPGRRVRTMLRAMRLYQWSKNFLVFLPALAAHDLSDVMVTLPGFIAFCLVASAVYLINDLFDLDADRAHPRKRRRPFASGELPLAQGVALAAGLLGVALVLSIGFGTRGFIYSLGLYLVSTFLYSLWLKRELIVDVLMLAGLYTIRIIAGGAITGQALSPWILGFSLFMFLALASVKRQAELTDLIATGRSSIGRAYRPDDLPILRALAMSSAIAAIVVLALYIASDTVQFLYTSPSMLWLVCPVILYWSLRMIVKSHHGLMTDDPIVFAFRDRVSLSAMGLCGLIVVAATIF